MILKAENGTKQYGTKENTVWAVKNLSLEFDEGELAAVTGKSGSGKTTLLHLLPDLTAKENILLPSKLDGRKPDRDWFTELAQTLELSDRLSHLPGELSGGQQQRVSIARAMMNRPQVLLCDEPTGNLDAKSGKEVVELLTRINEKFKTTVIIVTHDVGIADRMPRRIELVDGSVKL